MVRQPGSNCLILLRMVAVALCRGVCGTKVVQLSFPAGDADAPVWVMGWGSFVLWRVPLCPAARVLSGLVVPVVQDNTL